MQRPFQPSNDLAFARVTCQSHVLQYASAVNGTVTCGMLKAAIIFSFAMCFVGQASAQSPIDTPRTTLTPIDGLYSPQGPSGLGRGTTVGPFSNAPANSFGYPNATPRIRLGNAGAPFDPYAGRTFAPSGYPTAPNYGPSLNGPAFGAPGIGQSVAPPPFGGMFGGGSVAPGAVAQAPPVFGSGSMMGGGPAMGGFGSTIYPQSGMPSGSPSTLFPSGIFGNAYGGNSWGSNLLNGGPTGTSFRLVQGPRFRHTYIFGGDSQDDLSTNDSDVSLPFAWPNFLGSTRPLFVVPSFSLHLWDGPSSTTGADLPGNAYSAFLDLGWQTDPNQMFGLEFGARVGSFAEFGVWNSESLRLMGKGLASFRLTPFTTVKGGVYYMDRNRYKLLPAGGILWQPNPYTRFDIFFPQPKVARYWRTVGTRDVWGYLSGDIGGGNWTVKRDGTNQTDKVDINDIRVMAGLEWGQTDLIRSGRRTGFFEIGYVFDRELRYDETFVTGTRKQISLDDGFLFRLGFGY